MKYIKILFTAFLVLFTATIFAQSALEIKAALVAKAKQVGSGFALSVVPSSSSAISLGATSTTTLTYTVTNTSGSVVSGITANPGFNISPSMLVVTSSGCSGTTLAINGTCTLTLTLTGQNKVTQPGSPLELTPEVCGYNGAFCVTPIQANYVPVNITTAVTLVSITVSPNPATVSKSGTLQFAATGINSDGSTEDLTSSATWASSATSVAANPTAGSATGLTTGTTNITAASGVVTSATDTLTVTAATLSSIAITPSSPSVAKGATQQFQAIGTYSDSTTSDLTTSVVWSSATTSVATISSGSVNGGLVSVPTSATVSDTTNITASYSGVTSPTDTLTAAAAALTSIAVTPGSPYAPGVSSGLTEQFTATGTYSDGSTSDITTSVDWTSLIPGVATIGSSTGLATGGSTTGSSTITATDPTTSISNTSTLANPLVVGSYYDQGIVYCLGVGTVGSPTGSECDYLPSGKSGGEVIAQTDLISGGHDNWTADTDSVGLQWGGYGVAIGVAAQSDDAGDTNTEAIDDDLTHSLDLYPDQSTYAAGICTIYNSGDDSETWYLPAIDELNVIHGGLTTLNTAGAQLPTTGVYWSSTEYSSDSASEALALHFGGSQIDRDKVDVADVRCVRAF